jgi:hypothetical protein
MKRFLSILLALAGCCPACPPPPPAPPLSCPDVAAVRPMPPAPVRPTQPPTVAEVTDAYTVVAAKESAAITAPGATPDFVRSVQAADRNAQTALKALATQGRHPRKNTLYWARSAVKTLADVLAQNPGGTE